MTLLVMKLFKKIFNWIDNWVPVGCVAFLAVIFAIVGFADFVKGNWLWAIICCICGVFCSYGVYVMVKENKK